MAKILVVDDENLMVRMVQIRLEASGYEVITACDGEEGLKKAKKENPDLIILDIMMPKMDGHEVCRLLKADERYERIPIIILSAKTQKSDIDKSLKAGAEAHVTKPFEPKVLLAKIKEVLNR
jgi:two-component system alkaline phosphatase synthesis response regulator PhoP